MHNFTSDQWHPPPSKVIQLVPHRMNTELLIILDQMVVRLTDTEIWSDLLKFKHNFYN